MSGLWRTRHVMASGQRCRIALPTSQQTNPTPLVTRQFVRNFNPEDSRVRRMTRTAAKNGSSGTTKGGGGSLAAMAREQNELRWKSGSGPLLPAFVPLPVLQMPGGIGFFKYLGWRFRHLFSGLFTIMQLRADSMPGWTTRPKFRSSRGNIVSSAQALNESMLQAIASGDKTVINDICTGDLARTLCATIDRRKPTEKLLFEYKRRDGLFHPRIMSRVAAPISHERNPIHIEQATVRIRSRQTLRKVETRTGKELAPANQAKDKVEYVVIRRTVEPGSWEISPWKIWGTVSPTTTESYLAEKKLWDDMALGKQ